MTLPVCYSDDLKMKYYNYSWNSMKFEPMLYFYRLLAYFKCFITFSLRIKCKNRITFLYLLVPIINLITQGFLLTISALKGEIKKVLL